MATYKTISNTFTVTTVEDGVSVPSYIQSQEAWSNQATSSSDTTMPSDCVESDWQDNTPQRNGKSYLWRRSRQMQLNSNNEYEVVGAAPGWKYQRLSGTNGTSISPKGTVVYVASSSSGLPSSGVTANDLAIVPSSAKLYKYSNGWSQVSTASSDGDCYVVENDCTYGGENVKGHMFMFSTETGRWIDLGQFKGENGATYYTHIAWASDVTIVNNVVTAISGFSVGIGANGEAKPWMGICIDQNSADPQTYTSYTWKYLKGEQGAVLSIDNTMDSMQYRNTYSGRTKITARVYTTATLYDKGVAVPADAITWDATFVGCSGGVGHKTQGGGFVQDGTIEATENPKCFYVDNMTQERGSVTITATYKGTVYTIIFTVVRLIDAKKYQLEVSPTGISYNRNESPSETVGVYMKVVEYSPDGSIEYLETLGNSLEFVVTAKDSLGDNENYTYPSNKIYYSSQRSSWYFWTDCELYDSYTIELLYGGETVDIQDVIVSRYENGAAGQNSIRLDLDNEMDALQYVGDEPIPNAAALTNAYLYNGATLVNAASITKWECVANNCEGYAVNGNNTNPKAFEVDELYAMSGSLTIKATYKGNVYSAVFSVDKLVNQDKYYLEILPNAIPYNTDNGIVNPNVKIYVWKSPYDGSAPVSISNLSNEGISLVCLPYAGATSGQAGTAVSLVQHTPSGGTPYWDFNANCASYSNYVVTLYKGTSSQGKVLDRETIPVAKVSNGIGSLVADLSNEMDAVPMTYEGAVIGSGSPKQVALSTTVTLFYGTDSQTITSMSAGQYSSSAGNIRVSFPKISGTNNYTGVANIYVTHNTTMTDDKVVIPITAVCALGSRTVEFTIQGVRAGAEGESPTIYQISLSSNEIKVASDGQRSISQIRAQIYKTTGNETPVAANTEKYLCYSIDSGTATPVPSNGVVPVDSVTTNITFRLYEDNTKTLLLDTETVPVVKDGDDSYWFDMQSATARVNQDGIMVVNLSWYVMRGGQIIAPTTDKCYTKLSGSSSWTAATKGLNTTANMWFNAADIGGHPYDSTNDGIDIKYVDANNLTRVTKRISFTKDGENSTMYEIRPSIGDSISIASNETNMTIATITVTFHKKDGDGAWQSISGYAAMYTKRVTTSGVEYGTAPHTRMTSSASSWTITGLNVHYSNTAYVIVFRTDSVYGASEAWSEDYIAKKEILITKQGNSPISYEIVVTSSEARIEPSGVMYGHVYWKLYSVQGTTRTELKNINATSGHAMQRKLNTANSWAAATWNSTSNIYTDGGLYNNIDWKSIRSTLSAIPSSVELRYVLNGIVVAYTEVEFAIQGQMGKNYYYAGEWSANKTYTVTTYTTPFVQYGTETSVTGKQIKRYYVLIAEDGYTSTNETPGNTGHWVRMTNSFDYLISNAVFTDFAQLGASVFNGDYMFSQHGYAVGYGGTRERVQDGSMFQYVDPENMEGTPQDVDDELTIWYETPNSNIMGEGDVQIDTAQLTSGLWYTFKIEGRGSAANETLEWILDAGGYYVATGSLGYNGDNVYQNNIVNFRYDSQEDLTLYVYETSGNRNAKLRHYSLRVCGFTPTYYLNLRTGQLVANDVTARGAIYADEGVFRGTVYAENGEFNGTVHATAGEFEGSDGMYGFNVSADERAIVVTGPSKVTPKTQNPSSIDDYVPTQDAQEVEYMRLGAWGVRPYRAGGMGILPRLVGRALGASGGTSMQFSLDAMSLNFTVGNELYASYTPYQLGGSHVYEVIFGSLPTSSNGLQVGQVWNDNGTLKIKQ